MNIVTWVNFALWVAQYSYTQPQSPVDSRYLRIESGDLVSCIYAGDKPFKKGSNTAPRSELRLRDPVPDGVYNASVSIKEIPGEDTEFSLWQLFGSNPLVMIRRRLGVKQLLVFDGKPKIQVVKDYPQFCTVKCGRGGYVECGQYRSEGRIRCNGKLHMKVGVYAQGTSPLHTMCARYGSVSLIEA